MIFHHIVGNWWSLNLAICYVTVIHAHVLTIILSLAIYCQVKFWWDAVWKYRMAAGVLNFVKSLKKPSELIFVTATRTNKRCCAHRTYTRLSVWLCMPLWIGHMLSDQDWEELAAQSMERFSIDSCVRGYHVYSDIWEASGGEELPCQCEHRNTGLPT